MPKITMKCVDCGKERTNIPSRFKNLKSKEEYRCISCYNKSKSTKTTYKCIDCGKESSKRSIFHFHDKTEESYRCKECSYKFRRDNGKSIYKCVDCGKEKIYHKSQFEKLVGEEYRCSSCTNKKNAKENIIYKENHKIAMKNLSDRKSWKENIHKIYENPIYRENRLISSTGQGFWYGHPIINGRNYKKYCELWNRDLWNRIDAAWDFKSSISGKTKEDNKNKHLDRHHVYWQEKACCKWDEDTNGYYAYINLGTKSKPNIVKYYIKGDPNKFVLLTHNEHTMIRGSKQSGKNKIWWIKFFEDLIEKREKEGKKCYLSKEEYEIYKVDHLNIINIYTNKV